MTLEQLNALPVGAKLVYYRLTPSAASSRTRTPTTVYFASVSQQMANVIFASREIAVDPKYLELPAGEIVVDERMVKVFGRKK